MDPADPVITVLMGGGLRNEVKRSELMRYYY
jgi:hypothetical protein